MKNDIIAFYVRNELPNEHLFCFDDIFNWSLFDLEHKHDYIQWFFPLTVASEMHPDSPVLTYSDLQRIRKGNYSKEIREKQQRAFYRMLDFYQFKKTLFRIVPKKLIITRHDWNFCGFDMPHWIVPGGSDHNYLRVTRILTSLILFGNERLAKQFFNALMQLNESFRLRSGNQAINDKTKRFWKDAIKIDPKHVMYCLKYREMFRGEW